LIDVSPVKAVFVFVVAVIAMLLFASATQGFMFTRNRKWESAALLLIAFTLFRPGYWLDQVVPPFDQNEPTKVFEVMGAAESDAVLNMVISGPDFDSGEVSSTTILVPVGEQADGSERLGNAGLNVLVEDGLAKVEEPFPGTPYFETIGKTFDFYAEDPVTVSQVLTKADRLPKEIFYIPAVLLLALIVWLQRRRARTDLATA